MKAKFVAINWLVSFAPLTYKGDDGIIIALAVLWFVSASLLLNKHSTKLKLEADKFNKWIENKFNKE